MIRVENLSIQFQQGNQKVEAVKGISFEVGSQETVALVGESGSGKSVTAHAALKLLPPQAHCAGKIWLGEEDLLDASESRMRQVRGQEIGMIFQEPMTSLNPLHTIGSQISEAVLWHHGVSQSKAETLALDWLERVEIPQAKQRLRSYPHELSGGQRQRVMIAMALVNNPRLLIADEPTTALDVTVQAQILELIKEMQQRMHMGVLFISHDLGVVAGFCDRVNVMYAGRIVESGSTHSIYYKPSHPYNEALQQSIPALQPKGKELFTIEGQPPDLTRPLNGCSFAERCVHAQDECKRGEISLKRLNEGHYTSCRRVQEGDLKIGV